MYILSEKKLKTRILEAGLQNLSHFAGTKGLNRNTIHGYLRGQPVFTRQFQHIADALGCSPVDLIEEIAPESHVTIPNNIQMISDRITETNPLISVFLFGSRLAPGHHLHSDWDLGITHARKPLSAKSFFSLKNKVEPVLDDIPEQIDLVNLDQAPDGFIREMGKAPVYIGGNELAKIRFIKKWEKLHGK